MAIIIQKPTSDLYLTQNEYNRLLAKYQQAFQFYSGTPPTFETWAKQQKEYESLVAERDALADALMGLLDFGTSVNSNLVGDRYAAAHKALATLRHNAISGAKPAP